MLVDLSNIPTQWFLYGLEHKHSTQLFEGDIHLPVYWYCELRHVKSSKIDWAYGETPQEAVDNVINQIQVQVQVQLKE